MVKPINPITTPTVPVRNMEQVQAACKNAEHDHVAMFSAYELRQWMNQAGAYKNLFNRMKAMHDEKVVRIADLEAQLAAKELA